LLLVIRLVEKLYQRSPTKISCGGKNFVNKIISITQQDTFSMIANKSQASGATFSHLSFYTIY
jgi:hypothetical protein